AESGRIREAIDLYRARLKEAARSYVFDPIAMLFVAIWGPTIVVTTTLIDEFVNPAYRHYVFDAHQTVAPPLDHWLYRLAPLVAIFWLFGLPLMPGIALVRFLSGGMRIWPGWLKAVAILSALHRL